MFSVNQPCFRLGSKVRKIKKGSRYAVLSIGGCIQCFARANGFTRASLPEDEFLGVPFFGLGGDGGHAEYAVVDQDELVPVVSSPLTHSRRTSTYHP